MDEPPVHDRLHLGRPAGRRVVRIGELVREAPVQVRAARVVALAQLRAVRVHGGQDPDLGVVDERGGARVGAVAVQKVVNQPDADLLADHLVAVNGGDVADRGLVLADPRVVRDLHHPELAPLHRLAEALEAREIGSRGGDRLQLGGERRVGVVGGRDRAGSGRQEALSRRAGLRGRGLLPLRFQPRLVGDPLDQEAEGRELVQLLVEDVAARAVEVDRVDVDVEQVQRLEILEPVLQEDLDREDRPRLSPAGGRGRGREGGERDGRDARRRGPGLASMAGSGRRRGGRRGPVAVIRVSRGQGTVD